MANEKLQVQIDAVDKATETLKKVQGELENFKGKTEKVGQSLEKVSKSNHSLTQSFIKAELIVAGLSRGFGFLLNQYQRSTELANEYQRAVVGLNSTAAAFGESQDKARAAAQRLTSDGLLSVADASKSLQNLLTTGIGLDKAEQLMNAYKNQAALGRANSLSYSQAVANLAESFLTESSAIGNLSGQSENYNQILERGANILGKNVMSLSDAERQQAKYLGTVELAKVVHGDLARYLETADAQAQIFTNQIERLQMLFGQALSPAIQYAVQTLSAMVSMTDGSATPAMQNLAKSLVYLVGLARVTGKIFLETGQAIANALKGPQIMLDKAMKGDFLGALTEPWKNTFNSFKDAAIDVSAEVDKVSQDLARINGKIDKEGIGAYGNVFREKAKLASTEVAKAGKEIADKLKKIGEDVSKELGEYARSAADRLRSFTESMKGLVLQHKNTINDLRTQINELNAGFNEAAASRLSEHTERKAEIEARYKEETEVLRQNLARRLTESVKSDEQLTAFFQAQIAAKEAAKNEELKKEEEKYTKEESKQLTSHTKQLNALQTKLNAELEIERKHRAEFEQFKDAVEEDDITRLKNSFEREMAEIKRQHEERMNELRKQQEEITGVKGGSTGKSGSQANASGSAKGVFEYIVKAGDTLSGIAQRYLGNASRWGEIKGYSGSPNKLGVGTRLQVPVAHEGMVIPGSGEVPILAKGGETILNQQQTQGMLQLLKNIGITAQGNQPNVQMTNHIYNQVDLVSAMREMGWRTRIR